MASFSWVDTSLDLNSNPLRFNDDPPPGNEFNGFCQKKETDFIHFTALGTQISPKEEKGALVEELNRVSEENKKLTEMLTVMCENYNGLRKQLADHMNKSPDTSSKKRKSESSNNVSESSSTDEDQSSKKPTTTTTTTIKAKASKVHYRTQPNDSTLVVKDGYQWRKYGQKVTRDNPSPRAYFKCSFAPSCPVKKKVQRSVEDQSVLVATYEGEHNHPPPSQMDNAAVATSGSSRSMALGSSVPCSTTQHSTSITFDLTKSKSGVDGKVPLKSSTPEVRQYLVEQMATSLTKDPNFTAALAAAISGKMFQNN